MTTDSIGQKKDAFSVVSSAPADKESLPATQDSNAPEELAVQRLPDGYDEPDEPAGELEQDHSRRLAAINKRHEARLTHALSRAYRANSLWDEIQGEVNRQPRYSSPWFYMPFMIALSIAEVPINRLSFELFFRESPLISLVVSLLVGGILVTLAHRVGMLLCRFGYYSKLRGWKVELAQVLVVTLLIGALCYGLSVLRQGFLQAAVQPEIGFADAMSGTGSLEMLKLNAALGLEGWIFLFINLAVVLVGVSAAFFCHDGHPDFQKADIERKRAEKAVAVIRSHIAEAEAAEQRRHANQLRRLAG
ncbi:MAG: hypothetical protein R3C00_07145 [Hyphomonas sp.]|nr:hypothetical protein [Hyphomonas sp.]MCB9961974.1 hypothetical protein [Hyphomonas sp.]MCB9970966.1 hypothetical protein [Hyphomonas sp.]